MSLLDVLDQVQGTSKTKTSKPTNYQTGFLQPYTGSGGGGGGSSSGGSSTSARNSRERSAPERFDFTHYVPEGFGNQLEEQEPSVPMQALEVAGRAPGFVAERPLALVDQLLGDQEGHSVLDDLGNFGPLKFLGEAVHNISTLPGALANSSTADSLVRGTREGWTDDQPIQSTLDRLGGDPALGAAISTNPLFAPFAAFQRFLNGDKKGPQTWGEFKQEAALKGWTSQDVDDLMAGRKSSTDFGDRSMSTDPLTEVALRMGSDPLNLVFGIGAAAKLASGTGFLIRATKAGAMLEAPLAPSLAAAASAQGIARASTWFGLAEYFGQAGRVIGVVPGGAQAVRAAATAGEATARALSGYKKLSIGTTAAQVGLGVVDKATENVRGGFLEPLFQLNRDVWDNQPLSQNSAFSLFAAFHFDAFRGAARALGAAKTAKTAMLGSPIRADVVKALQEGEGWNGQASGKAVIDRLGGPEALDNLIVHTHAQIVFERLMKNPVIRATLSHFDSLDEAILSNQKLGEQIENILIDEYKGNRFTGKQTVAQLKAWHANRSGVNQSGIEFQWDGAHAADRWVEYSAAVAPVSKIFNERGEIVLGLVDHVLAEDLRNMGSALRVAGGSAKQVPIAEVRRWLSRFPQLTEDPWWGKFNLREWDGQTVPYGPMQGKLSRLAKEAPSSRDVTREEAAVEGQAARQEFMDREPVSPFSPATQISVSRMRPQIARRLGLNAGRVDDIMAARGDADVAAFEGNVGKALHDAGLPIDAVEQSIGAWEGSLEPSVQVAMGAATLPELRLAAAMLGRAGKQDAVALAVTGPRVRELGLDANGFEVKIALPSTGRAQLQSVHQILASEFPGYTINDSVGIVSVLVPAGERATLTAALERVGSQIEGLYPKDLIGDSGVAASVHPAYIEFITKKRGDGDGSYAEVIAEARRYGDARADAAASVEAALAHRRRTGRDAASGLPAPAGDPGTGPVASDLALSPAGRVGLGSVDQAPAEAGFLYHSTDEAALQGIVEQGLQPRNATGTAWYDGGTGRRVWYSDTPIHAAEQGGVEGVLLRVRQTDAGRVRGSVVDRELYSGKSVKPSLVEVYGADGQWYPASEWFAPILEPDIAQGAQTVLPTYQRFYHGSPRSDLTHVSADPAQRQYDNATSQFGAFVTPSRREAERYAGEGGRVYEATAMPKNPYEMSRQEFNYFQSPERNAEGVMDMENISQRAEDLKAEAISLRQRLEAEGYDGIRVVGNRGNATEIASFSDVPVRFDPIPDELTAGLRAHEDQPWQAPGAPADEAELMSELASLSGDTELAPESVARAQAVQGRLEATRLAKGEARKGEVLWAAGRDAEVSSQIPLHRSLSGLDDVSKSELSQFERDLREHYPMYTLQRAPNAAIIKADRGELAAQYLRDRTLVGDVLANWGPTGRISKFMDWLAAPVRNEELGRQARQALMNELIPKGAKPREVDEFLARLDSEASRHTIGPMGIRVFRNGTSMTQQAINRIAGGDPELGIVPAFSDRTINAIGRDNFARVVDRASNRFIQSLDRQGGNPGARGALARNLTRAYDGFAHSFAGDTTRLVSKTMYHWFRFIADPRWWAMNLLEADMIGGLKYGIGSTRLSGAHRAEVGKPSLFHQLGGKGDNEAFERALGDGNGWLYTRRQGGYISRAFDEQRPETVTQIIRELPQNDPIIADLKEIVAQQDRLDGRTARTPGEVMDEDMVEAIDRLLYTMDEKGAKATIVDEAREILGAEETQRLLPFLQKVWEANDKTYHGIVEMFHGNPHRTNLERIANSYWLYWPISYQIKATKWLVNVMAKGALGKQTNLAGAALYAHHVEEHRKRLASDPNYVAMFEEHPTAWFMAQMLFPITPGDIGVSLSRPVRYGVGAAGDVIEDATGSRLGLWGSYKSAEDPITAAGAILSMGPVYTSELLARLGREVFTETTENIYP